mmetsp:Transcript_58759/g.65745  ORF Transcript_58759/g.65745 Transcript_58759/m.65745 type:complete len:112 (+) Transcript_58759:125-460(+)
MPGWTFVGEYDANAKGWQFTGTMPPPGTRVRLLRGNWEHTIPSENEFWYTMLVMKHNKRGIRYGALAHDSREHRENEGADYIFCKIFDAYGDDVHITGNVFKTYRWRSMRK